MWKVSTGRIYDKGWRKQRSVLVLSAFNITACQQQKQCNGGVDLWQEEKGFVRLELKRSNYITIATKSQLKARQIWSQQRFECLNIFFPSTNNCSREFFFLPWTVFQQNDDNSQDRYLNANATQLLRTSHGGHFQKLGGVIKIVVVITTFEVSMGKNSFDTSTHSLWGASAPKLVLRRTTLLFLTLHNPAATTLLQLSCF